MIDEAFTSKLLPIFSALQLYHRYEVIGLDKIPTSGPVIMACTHSLATYDMLLLMAEVYKKVGRIPCSLIDRLFYKIPGLGPLMERTGCVLGTYDNAASLLANAEMLYIAPGGMRESLRPMTERYQILWEGRRGFVKLSIETGAPIVLAACPKADDLYDVYPNALSSFFYKHLKVPVFLARGLGLSPIPKPVQLRHFISEPIPPPVPKGGPAAREKQIAVHHRKIMRRMRSLITEAIAYRGPEERRLSAKGQRNRR